MSWVAAPEVHVPVAEHPQGRPRLRLIVTTLAAAIAAFCLFRAVGLDRLPQLFGQDDRAPITVSVAPTPALPVAVARSALVTRPGRPTPTRRAARTRVAATSSSVGATATPGETAGGAAPTGGGPAPAPAPRSPADAPTSAGPAPSSTPVTAPVLPVPLPVDVPPILPIEPPALPLVPPIGVPALPSTDLPAGPALPALPSLPSSVLP